MVLRYLVEVVNVQLAIVLHFGVVEEEAFHPGAWRGLLRFCAQLLDDAADRHEFDHIRIADQDVVQQRLARRMIVAVDEPGHDGHLLGVEGLRLLAEQALISALLPTAVNRPAFTANASAFGALESTV